jgi:hypothetical protein
MIKVDRCYICQIKAGAKPPKWNPEMKGVTGIIGKCPDCEKDRFLFYPCDFDWPSGERAVFD